MSLRAHPWYTPALFGGADAFGLSFLGNGAFELGEGSHDVELELSEWIDGLGGKDDAFCQELDGGSLGGCYPPPVGKGTVRLAVDRASVSMGDDIESHATALEVSRGTLLSDALGRCVPDVRMKGWSWVVTVDGETTAVWSVDHEIQLLVPDRGLKSGADVYFRYFLQIDPAWLFDRLSAGDPANRNALEGAYAPIAQAQYREALLRREWESDDRPLSTECIEALEHYGARITLHADMVCEFTYADEEWVAERRDSMFVVAAGPWRSFASLRPHLLGETWLVGMLGVSERVARGLPEFPEIDPSQPKPTAFDGLHRGAVVVQVRGQKAEDVTGFVMGRTVSETRELLGV